MKYALTDQFEGLLGHPIPERGVNAMVYCPFHDHNFGTPSLSINLDTGLWMCFVCPARGSIQKMAALLGGTLDAETMAIRSAAAVLRVHEDEPDPDFTELADSLYMRAKVEKPPAIVHYITQRGLSLNTARHFRIGWDGRRMSMPYYDEDAVRAIKYRSSDGFKSYETGSHRFPYNINEVRDRPMIVLCEGESDTHAVWSHLDRLGEPWNNVGVAGIPGTNASRSTWELWAFDLMLAKRIYVAFDADEAGDTWAEVPLSVFGSRAVRIRPTRGKDMTDHLLAGGTLDGIGMGEMDLHSIVAA
jgi:DNA primase